MKLFLPEYIWMATGNKQNFKKDLLLPLKSQEIIAFPDKSEFSDWKKRADELNRVGFKIEVSDYIEKQDYVKTDNFKGFVAAATFGSVFWTH